MAGFVVLALVLIASAVAVVSAKNPVHSVVALLLNFAALAVFYLTLSGEFLAMIQIIVYSGAILILFVFVIALLSSGVRPFKKACTMCRFSAM
ncbi:MAG: NADH-quinone oxidoreductase subunit J [bacterium]|nr:NADH-quinone oxidoreductase subunit J [bacterium]